MKRRNPNRSLAVLALCLSASLSPMIYADDGDGPVEKTGEKVDETADMLREGAKKGLRKAGETLEKTGKAVSEGAKEVAEAVDGDGE